MQVEGAVVALVEVHAPADEFLYLGGRALHYLFHGGAVAYPVARNHCVLNVFLEVVHRQVGYRGDASLGEVRVGLFHACLADEGHGACLCHFQGEAHPGDARADDEEVEFLYHSLCVLLPQMYANSAFLVPLCADYCGKWLPSRQKETMNRVFHARILPGHYLALGVFAYLLIHAFWVHSALLALLCMVVLVLVVERVVHTQYTVTADGKLQVDRGRFSKLKEIAPADILRVEQAKAPLLGRLLVSHCVLVHCKDGKTLTLVPVKEEEFVRVLRKRVQEAAGVA